MSRHLIRKSRVEQLGQGWRKGVVNHSIEVSIEVSIVVRHGGIERGRADKRLHQVSLDTVRENDLRMP